MPNKSDLCSYCNKGFDSDDLRPYGENQSLICYDCGMKPENRATTEKYRDAQIEKAILEGNGIIVFEASGPRAVKKDEDMQDMIVVIMQEEGGPLN